VNATPAFFGTWLTYLRTYTRETRPGASDPFIFVNAWNEWGEGCHLEPDVQWGLAYLDEIARSSHVAPEEQVAVELARKTAFQKLQQQAARDGVNIKANLDKHKPLNSRVQRMEHMLRKIQVLHTIARKLYRAAHALLH
jgi:hypothetical protein